VLPKGNNKPVMMQKLFPYAKVCADTVDTILPAVNNGINTQQCLLFICDL